MPVRSADQGTGPGHGMAGFADEPIGIAKESIEQKSKEEHRKGFWQHDGIPSRRNRLALLRAWRPPRSGARALSRRARPLDRSFDRHQPLELPRSTACGRENSALAGRNGASQLD